jgi:hypothetical protein
MYSYFSIYRLYCRQRFPSWLVHTGKYHENITKSYKVILIFTDHSIKSKWCEYEADQALIVRLLESKQNCVIPIILEQCEIPKQTKTFSIP